MVNCDPTWRGGRVVEGAALEMLFRGNSNEGSNPSLSVYIAEGRGQKGLEAGGKTS